MDTTETVLKRRTDLLKLLQAGGHDAEPVDDTDILVKEKAGKYLIILEERDGHYYRICFPGFLQVSSQNRKIKVMNIMNSVSARIKAVKLLLIEQSCWAVIEAFHQSPQELMRYFDRYMSIIELAVRDTLNKWEGK